MSAKKTNTKFTGENAKWIKNTGLDSLPYVPLPNDKIIDPLRVLNVPRSANEDGVQSTSVEDNKTIPQAALKQALLKFRILPSDHMRQLLNFFRTDSLMRIIFDIGRRALLSGGIGIQHGHRFESSHLETMFQDAWERFTSDLLESLWVFGFALCVHRGDKFIHNVPMVLPLADLTVRYHQDAFGQRYYAVSHRPDPAMQGLESGFLGIGPGGGASLASQSKQTIIDFEHLIEGVHVFELSPPLPDGSLTSHVATIFPDVQEYKSLAQAYIDYASYHSVPPVYVRHDIPKNSDTAAQIQATRAAAEFSALPDVGGADGAGFPDSGMPYVPETERYVQQLINKGSFADVESARRYVELEVGAESSTIRLSRTTVDGIRVYDLPPQRIIDRQVVGKEPGYVEHFYRSLQARVGAVFGVPSDLFGDVKGNRSGNVEHRMFYHETVRGLRQLIIKCIRRMYLAAWGDMLTTTFLATRDQVSLQELEAASDVSVTLPGIIPIEILDQWYTNGIIDYDNYTTLLSKSYSLPRNCFAPKALLTLKELNNIKPEPKQTNTGSASNSKSISSSSSTKKHTASGSKDSKRQHASDSQGNKKKIPKSTKVNASKSFIVKDKPCTPGRIDPEAIPAALEETSRKRKLLEQPFTADDTDDDDDDDDDDHETDGESDAGHAQLQPNSDTECASDDSSTQRYQSAVKRRRTDN